MNSWTDDRLIPDGDNAIGTSGSPAAVVFNNKIYLFHQGRGNDGLIWFSTFDGYNWSDDRRFPMGTYYGLKDSPAAAVFNNKIYVVYHDPNDELRVGTMDSWGNWTNIEVAPRNRITYSPSVAVWNNKLWVVYQGGGDNEGNLMCMYTTDGRFWTHETRILNLHLRGTPSLAVYCNYLHCFYKGADEEMKRSDLKLIGDIIDLLPMDSESIQITKIVLDVASAVAPTVGEVRDTIDAGLAIGQYINHARGRFGDWIWHTAFDGSNWIKEALCPTSEDAYGINGDGPAAIEYSNGLFCIRQGRDHSYLWCGVYDGENWHLDEQMSYNGNTFCTTGAPALVVYNGTSYGYSIHEFQVYGF